MKTFFAAIVFSFLSLYAFSQCDSRCSGRGSGSFKVLKEHSDRQEVKFMVTNLCEGAKKIEAEYKSTKGDWYTLFGSNVASGSSVSGVGYNVSVTGISWRWRIYGTDCSYNDKPSWTYE